MQQNIEINYSELRRTLIGFVLLYGSAAYLALIFAKFPAFIYFDNTRYFLLYYLPKVIPLIAAGIYILKRNPPPAQTVIRVYKGLLLGTVLTAVTVTTALLFFNQTILNSILTEDYNWSMAGWLTWNYGFIAFFAASYFTTKEIFYSFTYATLGISAGGLIYELPICFSDYQAYIHTDYPFCIATAWISLGVLAWMIQKKHGHPTKPFAIALAIFFATSIIYKLTGNPLLGEWLPRIPTVLLLATIPTGFKKQAYAPTSQ